VVASAKVELENSGTFEKRTTTSSAEGRYSFSQLLPGTYTLTAEATGFKKFVQQGIDLKGSQTAEVNVSLQVGSATESVEVNASASVLNTQTADQSTRIETNTLASLPINMRTPFAIVWANAGVSEAFDIRNATGDQNYNRFGMNGGRTESTAILIDGVSSASGSQWNGNYYSPTMESVAEVQLVRNTYDAQYGKSGGGVFAIVTKGGTAQFHGTAFEFLRNSKMDANNFFNNLNGRPLPFYARNQFGGDLGGPIWKSKRLFFFGSYEGLRQGSPSSTTMTVPTALQRQGNFSQTYNTDGSLQMIYDPATLQAVGNGTYTRTPFPGNIVPQNRYDTVGANVMAAFPTPNLTGQGITGVNNWFGSGKGTVTNDHYDLRADWTRTDKHSVYFRWSQARENSTGVSYPALGIMNTNMTYPNPRGHAVFGNTFLISPTLVVNVLLGHGFWTEQDVPVTFASATKLGMPASQVAQFMAPNIMPQFTFSNYSSLGFGTNGQLYHPERTESLQVNATKDIGKHEVKLGYSMELGYMNGPGSGGWLSAPTFNFSQGITSATPGISTTTSGNALASLLLGQGSGGSAPYNDSAAQSYRYYGLYVQDAWRLTDRLTLNLGMRWELQQPVTDRFNRYTTFLQNAPAPISVPGMTLRGAMQFVNTGGLGRGAWDYDWHDFAPRVSLAYKVTSKIVFRAGYGMFYVPTLGSGNLSGYSVSTPWITTLNSDAITPGNAISNPFPNGFLSVVGKSQGAATALFQGIDSLPRHHPNGYTENYSADIGYQINPNTLVEVGYSGNGSRKLMLAMGMNLNQLPLKDLGMGSSLLASVPNPFLGVIPAGVTGALSGSTIQAWRLLVRYPQYTGVTLDGSTPGGTASYNALLLKFTKRFSGGLNLIANYQWSKAIDNSSETQAWEEGDPGFRDMNNWSLERSISSHDIPQALAVTLLYELPFGRGKAIGGQMNAVANAVVGGWEVSGLIREQSGIPVRMSSATGNGMNIAFQPPNLTDGSQVSLSNPTVQKWFNTSSSLWSVPAMFTVGTAPRRITQLRQNGVHNADIAVLKSFPIREPLKLQFRAEFLNITNTPQFSAPNTTVGSNAFGTVTGTWNTPRQIQFSLMLKF
jgi:hypothetical protein